MHLLVLSTTKYRKKDTLTGARISKHNVLWIRFRKVMCRDDIRDPSVVRIHVYIEGWFAVETASHGPAATGRPARGQADQLIRPVDSVADDGRPSSDSATRATQHVSHSFAAKFLCTR